MRKNVLFNSVVSVPNTEFIVHKEAFHKYRVSEGGGVVFLINIKLHVLPPLKI